jgi:hypothetical protein
MEEKINESMRRQIEEAERIIREDWPDWLRRNRDAVHVPVRAPKPDSTRSDLRRDA